MYLDNGDAALHTRVRASPVPFWASARLHILAPFCLCDFQYRAYSYLALRGNHDLPCTSFRVRYTIKYIGTLRVL